MHPKSLKLIILGATAICYQVSPPLDIPTSDSCEQVAMEQAKFPDPRGSSNWVNELKKLEPERTSKIRDELRRHGWWLYENSTKDANPSYCAGFPAWLTWRTKRETFEKSAIVMSGVKTKRRIEIEESPTIARFSIQSYGNSGIKQRGIFSSVHYSPDTVSMIRESIERGNTRIRPREPCAQPGGACPPARIDPLEKSTTAIVVKPIWLIVPADGRLNLPVWDYKNDPPAGCGDHPYDKWPSYVIVVGPKTNTKNVAANSDLDVDPSPPASHGQLGQRLIGEVSYTDFFWQRVETSNNHSDLIATKPTIPPEGDTGIGSIAILAGLHIISKELPTWSWNTYWWMPRGLRDESRYGDGRPQLAEPWSHYVMDSSLRSAEYVNRCKRPLDAIFNPYQEVILSSGAGKVGGLATNCRSCHEIASYPPTTPPIGLSAKQSKAFLRKRTATGFLWSIASYVEKE